MPKVHPAQLKQQYLTHVGFLKNLENAQPQRPPIENLVFEGGGAKGIIYVGVVEALEQYQILKNVQRVAGSSAGGIIAALLVMGFNGAELKKVLTEEIKLKYFMDDRKKSDPKLLKIEGLRLGVSNFINLFKRGGLYKGDAFKKILGKLIKNKLEQQLEDFIRKKYAIEATLPNLELPHTYVQERLTEIRDQFYIYDFKDITFGQLHALKEAFPTLDLKDLYLTGTKLTDGSLKVFSFEHHPHMAILEALRITMSFPFGFEPVYYQGHYYADGGIADNYPMGIFDREPYLSHGLNDANANPCTLGFLVDSEEEIKKRWGIKDSKKNTLSVKNFISNIVNSIGYRMDAVKNKYSINSVQILDQAIKTMDLELSTQQIRLSIEAGKKHTEEYIQLYLEQDVLYEEKTFLDLYEKYFSMGKTQLLKFYAELTQGLISIESMQKKLTQLFTQNYAQKLERLIQNFPPELVLEQKALLEQSQRVQESITEIRSYIQAIQRRKSTNAVQQSAIVRKIQIFMEKLTGAMVSERALINEEIANLYKNFSDLQKEYNEITQEIKEGEEKLNYTSNALTQIENQKNRIVFDLLLQLKSLNYIEENAVLPNLARIGEIYHEHLDIVLDVLQTKNEKKNDPRFTNEAKDVSSTIPAQKVTQNVLETNIDFNHFISLKNLAKKFQTENCGDFVLYENRQDLKSNEENYKWQGFGKQISDYDVTTINVKAKNTVNWKGYKQTEKIAPLQAHLLIPSQAALSNSKKVTKDIVMVFPSSLTSGKNNFSVLQKSYTAHSRIFEANKQQFLTQLGWAIRQIREQSVPKDAKIQLTIFGASLGGLAAQLMVTEILNSKEQIDKFNVLENIELILQDAPKVEERQASTFAKSIEKLKKIDKLPSLATKHYKHKNYTRGLAAINYLGSCDLAKFVPVEDYQCSVQLISAQGTPVANYQKIQNANAYESCMQFSQSLLKQQMLQNISTMVADHKKMAKFLRKHFAPELWNVLSTSAHIGFKLSTAMLKIPYHAGHRLIREIKSWFKSAQYNHTLNWIAQLQRLDLPQNSSSSQEEDAYELFIRSTTKEKRLQREERPPIENIVLGGCGINSFAYVGALKSFAKSDKLKAFKRIAATSWGGLIAGLTAIGFHPNDLEKVIEQLKFSTIYDKPFPLDPPLFKVKDHFVGIMDIISLIRHKGVYKGQVFTQFIQSLIHNKLQENLKKIVWQQITPDMLTILNMQNADKNTLNIFIDKYLAWEVKRILAKLRITNLGEITFAQLKQLGDLYPQLNIKELYITATNLEQNSLKVFSKDSEPDMPIAQAMRMGMTCPGTFYPIKYDGCHYVEGSIADAYPMDFFNAPQFLSHGLNAANVNPCTLGLLVDKEAQIHARWGISKLEKKNILIKHLIHKVLEGLQNRTRKLQDIYQINSVQIQDPFEQDVKISVNLSDKKKLIVAGEKALDDYQSVYLEDKNLYDSRESYANFSHKYYQKSEQELICIFEQELEPALVQADRLLEELNQQQDILNRLSAKLTQELQKELVFLKKKKTLIEMRKHQLIVESQVLFNALHSKNANYTHSRTQEFKKDLDAKPFKKFTPMQKINTEKEKNGKIEKLLVANAKIAPKNP